MQLKLTRSQRTSGIMGKAIFVLDARAELTADERGLIKKYGLGKLVVYDSEARKKHQEAAYGNFTDGGNVPLTPGGKEMARSLWSHAKGIGRAAMMALSLRVTVDSLLGGEHIECKDLNELLGAEGAIRDACSNLKAYLETALTFDGREEVVEF